MRLFIAPCKSCNRRIYLSIVAPTRDDLAIRIGGHAFEIQCPLCGRSGYYTVHNVFAEMGDSSAVGGAILGGVVGLLGGPLGVLVGGALGAAFGSNADEKERENVKRFNGGSGLC